MSRNALRYTFSVLVGALALISGAASAHEYRIGSIHIDHPWAIATPNGAKVGAGYMKITNEGTEPDRLISLTSPEARKLTIHRSSSDDGVMKMRALDKGLEIKPGETVEMKPEGMHVMFEDLKAPLLEAGRAQGTLTFEKAGSVTVDFSIVPMGGKKNSKTGSQPAESHSHSH